MGSSKPNTAVIQMSRTYVNCSWNNADQNDYSGRQQPHMIGNKANLRAYEEKPLEKKAKKVREPDFRLTSERTIDRLEKHRADLDAAFEAGKLTFERYEILLNEWEAKMERAWKRNDKATGSVEESKEVEPNPSRPSIMPIIEDAAKSFCARHPFAFTVASVLFGCGILNIVGFGG